MNLQEKIDWSFNIFDRLSDSDPYIIAFSGGKDSHVLLGIYLEWCESRQRQLNLQVVFADTQLETPGLYKLIEKIKIMCLIKGISFIQQKPEVKHNFWVLQFGIGYPVPDYKNRWCTKYLKVQPVNKIIGQPITGTHLGESQTRDKRLNSCGSSECGIDKLTGVIEPLTPWRNCDIWDWLLLESDKILYHGVSDNLLTMYDIAESATGSLRMGCFMCPVVSPKTLNNNVDKGIAPEFTLTIRDILEELRQSPRINSERTKKAGAILVDARIKLWEKLKIFFPEMLAYGWITPNNITEVERLLAKRSYPPTYKQAWIATQEALLTTAQL